jgi:uncharacterized protein
MKKPTILLIRIYQSVFSGIFGGNCRFYPSCSCYAIEAIEEFGVLKGAWKTLIRLMKCYPFSAYSGFDPVQKIKE